MKESTTENSRVNANSSSSAEKLVREIAASRAGSLTGDKEEIDWGRIFSGWSE
jgi:hypothetical protein